MMKRRVRGYKKTGPIYGLDDFRDSAVPTNAGLSDDERDLRSTRASAGKGAGHSVAQKLREHTIAQLLYVSLKYFVLMQAYLLGLLAQIKCSICSYQHDS